MLERLTVDNFIRITHVDLIPTAPVVLVAGDNQAGKTSIKEAVCMALLDENPRVKYKKDRTRLVHGGARNGKIRLAWDSHVIQRSVRDGKITGDAQALPEDTDVARICLGAGTFADLSPNERRSFIMRLANVDLSVDNLARKLKQKGVSDEDVKKYRPLLKAGIEPAHAQARKRVSEATGAWQEVTGEKYGSVKAEAWEPERPVVSFKEVGTELAEIDSDLEAARKALDDELAPTLSTISALQTQIDEPDPLHCPDCGAAVRYDGEQLVSYDGGAAEKKKLQTRLDIMRMRAKSTREKHEKTISQLTEDRAELQAQVSKTENAEAKQRRASELHQEIVALKQIQELLGDGPDGVLAELISDGLKPLNERLIEIGSAIGWNPVAIMPDTSIQRVDGYLYELLSDSARWRADVMLQTLVSELAEFPWLIFDGMDILTLSCRKKLMLWLNEYGPSRTDECSILVMATLKEPPNLSSLGGIDGRWIESGEIM